MIGYYAIYLFILHCTLYFHLNVMFLFWIDSTFGIYLLMYECGRRLAIHDTFRGITYAFAQEGGHIVFRAWWYALMLGVSL
jgi:hypothetical protein